MTESNNRLPIPSFSFDKHCKKNVINYKNMIIKNNKFLKKRKDPETIVPKDEERFFFVALLIERANYDSWVILDNPR